MVMGNTGTVAPGSRTALIVLVALVALSPWPAGGIHLRSTQVITLVSLAAAVGGLVWDERRGLPHRLPGAVLPVAGLWFLAMLQLVPLPLSLHQVIAPGSAGAWYPDAASGAAILGPGPHPISLYPDSTRRSFALATGLFALAVAAAPALRDRRLLIRASIAVVTNGVLVAAYGLVARIMFKEKLYGLLGVPTIAPFGPFVSKNHFSGYIELVALLSVGLAAGLAAEARRGPGPLSWIQSRRAPAIIAAGGAAATLILAVPVSLSRGGVISLGAGLLAFAILRLWSRRGAPLPPRYLLALGAAAVLGLVAIASVLPTEARDRVLSLMGVATDQSGAYRLGVWRDTLQLIGSSPWLGSGFGAYEDALPRFKTVAGHLRVEHAENEYLELLAEGGLAGAALVVTLASLILRRGLMGVTRTDHRLTRGLITGALAGLVAIAVHSVFDFNLRIPSNAAVCAMLVALTLAVSMDSTPPRRSRATTLAIVLTLGTAVLTPWAESRTEPRLLWRAALSGASSLRRASLEADLRSHLQRQPTDAPAWLALAWCRFPTSREEASDLAAWAVSLDPTRQAIREAHSRLELHRAQEGAAFRPLEFSLAPGPVSPGTSARQGLPRRK